MTEQLVDNPLAFAALEVNAAEKDDEEVGNFI